MRAEARAPGPAAVACYEDDLAYVADELDALDLLLRLRVEAFRREWQAEGEPAGAHLYVSDVEVDSLLAREEPSPAELSAELRLRRELDARRAGIEARVAEGERLGRAPSLRRLAALFGLSPFEVRALVICLAPELRRRYDRIYAYLQDDITRRRPSVDLVLDLLCETEAERWTTSVLLSPGAPLLRSGLLETVEDPGSPSGSSGLAQFLRLDPRILRFVLGQGALDARLADLARVHGTGAPPGEPVVDPEVADPLIAYARRWCSDPTAHRPRTVLHLHGAAGAGKQELALAVCGALGRPMLSVDARQLASRAAEAEHLLRLALRESLLLQAPLYLAPADVFLREGDPAEVLRTALAREVETYGWFVILGGEAPWTDRALFERAVFFSAALPVPPVPVREHAWRRALGEALPEAPADLPRRLAERYRATPGQIREAVAQVADRRLVRGGGDGVDFEVLAAACRERARRGLGTLAARVDPRHGWGDLVLPDETGTQLRELCAQARHEHRVFDAWGFGRKLVRGRGLAALFTGSPGTGKTLAAEVVAGELKLDLYKIDLARVVSKYVGETEKNLARVFAEAEGSNAILFFDEADALFGKRTEVSDAHDRYANIETSFLLQRIEEYTGVVILASNLRENMDDAFLRRIRFVVDFPFPDAGSRLQIWKAHFPEEAPVCDGVDHALLAERLPVAGGSIKNIVLNAAFFAAADGGVIGMEHLLRGARREFEKIGKLWDESVLSPRKRR